MKQPFALPSVSCIPEEFFWPLLAANMTFLFYFTFLFTTLAAFSPLSF